MPLEELDFTRVMRKRNLAGSLGAGDAIAGGPMWAKLCVTTGSGARWGRKTSGCSNKHRKDEGTRYVLTTTGFPLAAVLLYHCNL